MKYRKCLEKVSAYIPGRSESEIKKEYNLEKVVKIASNENPYGPSLNVKKFLNDFDYNIYPDNYVTELRKKLANKLNVCEKMLLFGNGSVEIIQMLSRILLQEGANIITELPSFSSYFSEANIQDANIKTIAFNDNYSFDLKEMLKLIDENTKMIYITNPNNPLGSIVKKDEIISFVKNVPENILIVFDEAYGEFVRDEDYISAVSLVKEYKNVCVLKTFSKAYGLAALRIGYILADEEVINELEKVRVPFNVSTISQMCASIALDDESHIKYVTDSVHSTIDYMYKELNNMKLQFIKTEANFIMLNVGKNSKEVVYELLKKGYIVRDGFPLMDTWIRVSIGKREDMENFCKILKEVI